MAGLEMAQYHRLSNASEESDSSDRSMELPPVLKRVLDEHEYTMQKELGQGNSGKVFLVHDKDGDPCVIKQMNSRNAKELIARQKEDKILETLNHGYIVPYVKSFEDEEAGLFYIVVKYCEGGDLFKRMKTQMETQTGVFEEHQILDWLVQICLALQCLHKNKILHRNIKPQNVFLTEEGYINLGDFGFSILLERADAYAHSVVGAELYASPEVRERRYNSKSDIWSLGWLLYDLCMLDVWSNIEERRFQQASHNTGRPLHLSDTYSEELRELIRQMLSRDPEHRPSADEILAKPFLNDAVKRNKRIPESLIERFLVSFNAFDEACNNHFANLKALVDKWGELVTSLEGVHYNCTAGALSGSVFGAAGAITAVVGAILAPFTFGASLIVTGVGMGVGLAGGVAGAASSITNAVKQNSLREELENILKNYKNESEPILNSLNTLRKVLKKITKFIVFINNSDFDNVHTSCSAGKTKLVWGKELTNLGLLANVSIIAAQTAGEVAEVTAEGVAEVTAEGVAEVTAEGVAEVAAEVVAEVAAAAVSGVVSGLLVIANIAFIVKDSIDIHQMRQGNIDDPEKIKSRVLKYITQVKKTHTDLLDVLKSIKDTREGAVKIKALIEWVTETSNEP